MNALTQNWGDQGSPNTDRCPHFVFTIGHPAGPIVMEERPLDFLGRYQTLVHCTFQTSEDTCQTFRVIALTSSMQNRGEGSRVAFLPFSFGEWVVLTVPSCSFQIFSQILSDSPLPWSFYILDVTFFQSLHLIMTNNYGIWYLFYGGVSVGTPNLAFCSP